MNNKTSLLDAILELQRTLVSIKIPDQAPRDPELLQAYRELEAEYNEMCEELNALETQYKELESSWVDIDLQLKKTTLKYEDSARDFEVQSAILESTRRNLENLQIEFHLKMQQADEALKRNKHDEAVQYIADLEAELGERGQELQSAHAELSDLRDLVSTMETETTRLQRQLAEAEQEIDELEAESESATLALISEVKNLESELANIKGKLDEVLYAAESETLQLREECQQAKQDSENNLRRFVQMQHTSMLLSEENVKLRATVDELNIEGDWRQTAERERAQRELVEARLRKLEQMFRDVLDN
jgi:hypothetical protein